MYSDCYLREHFTMRFLWSLLGALISFWLIDNTTSYKVRLETDHLNAPLALIKKRDLTIELAIPQGYEEIFAIYSYENFKDDTGIEEEFVIACPAQYDWFLKEPRWEEELKNNKKLSQLSRLFIMHEFTIEKENSKCSTDVIPSVEKEKRENNGDEYCGESEAEIYNVGYPVLVDEEKEEMQVMSMYKICYSTTKEGGTLYYTIHRLVSPSSLLQKLWLFYTIDPKLSLKSSLDKDDEETKSLYKKHYAYQFVGFDDMPTKPWEHTTTFSFNYFPIPKNKDLLTGLIAVDNYIRLFSKETNKSLTLYSGLHQKMKEIPSFLHLRKIPKQTPINSFWRVIMDSERYAVIVVTQYTLMKCEENFICPNNQVIKQYKNGGCTYTCSATDEMIEKLGLPKLNIMGDLTLTFPQKFSTETAQPPLDKQGSAMRPSKDINIFAFMEKGKFKKALAEADADLEEKVQIQSSKDVRGYVGNKPFKDKDCSGSGGTGCFGGGIAREGEGSNGWGSWFTAGAAGGYVATDIGGGGGGFD